MENYINVYRGDTATIAEVCVVGLIFTGEAKLHPKDARNYRHDQLIGDSLAISRAFALASEYLEQSAQRAIDSQASFALMYGYTPPDEHNDAG